MKTKTIFCMFFMLFLFSFANSFALVQPISYNEEMSISFLDTVVVYDCVKTPLYTESPPGDGSQAQVKYGMEILVKFSNGLVYDYVVPNQTLAKELEEKGSYHIYNVYLMDIVVVKVVVTSRAPRIAEFVDNLSARQRQKKR